jgi:outer membrane protein assembly factor BamB
MVTLALTLPLASASGWAQFHGDVTHTGYSTSNAPDTNHTAWKSDDIDANCASSVTIADGRIFVYCWDYLVCIDEYTGSVLWNVSVESAPYSIYTCRSWVTPAYHDGRVFLSAADTHCFNATDGSEVWNFTHPADCGAINGGCAITDGMVFTSDWDGRHYYCLDECDGTEIWNFTVADDDAQSTPAISDGMVVFGGWTLGYGGHIYCVNMTTGLEEWNITTPDHPCGSAAISEGVVYMTTYDFSPTRDPGELYALNITDGSEIWSQPVERTDSTPALAYGNVYVCGGCMGSSDLMTYCFNATTGELLWNTSASDEIGNWKRTGRCLSESRTSMVWSWIMSERTRSMRAQARSCGAIPKAAHRRLWLTAWSLPWAAGGCMRLAGQFKVGRRSTMILQTRAIHQPMHLTRTTRSG